MGNQEIDVDSDNLKDGLLGLVIALVEIIRDALKLQALRRMENDRLSEEQIEKLGAALVQLDDAIEEIKDDQDISRTVNDTRQELNDVVNEVINPERWETSN